MFTIDYVSLPPDKKYSLYANIIKEAVVKSTPVKRRVNKLSHRNPVP